MSLGTRCCFYTGAHERFSKEQTIFPRALASQPPTERGRERTNSVKKKVTACLLLRPVPDGRQPTARMSKSQTRERKNKCVGSKFELYYYDYLFRVCSGWSAEFWQFSVVASLPLAA